MANTDKPTLKEQFADRTIYIIAAFAIVTIGISVWLVSTNHPLSQPATAGGSTYLSEPAHHAHVLVFSSVLLAGVVFSNLNDKDQDLTDLLLPTIIGVGLAYGIGVISSPSGDQLIVYTPLTSRPLLTATVGGLALVYLTLLYTRYDWLAINSAATIITPPVIAPIADRPIPLLIGVLFLTAVFDYYAVHRSSTMENMVKSLTPLRPPLAFFVPTTARSYSEAIENDLTGIRMLGLGDVIIPGVFVAALAQKHGVVSPPVIIALLGYLVAYAIIVTDPFGEDAYAALPFLNTGVSLGYASALLFL